jgi:hypothetical protein
LPTSRTEPRQPRKQESPLPIVDSTTTSRQRTAIKVSSWRYSVPDLDIISGALSSLLLPA